VSSIFKIIDSFIENPVFLNITTVISVITTIVPYWFYTWVYKYPKSFSRFMTQKQFIHFAQINKLVGIFSMAPPTFHAGVSGAGLCIGLPFVFIGQYLNELVYNILGDPGVYYGLELRKVKPANLKGFPWTIRDPQYKGSIMTVIGWFFSTNPSARVIIIFSCWMFSYFFQVIVENTPNSVDWPLKID